MRFLSVGFTFSLVALALLGPVAVASEPWQSEGPAGTDFHSLSEGPDGTIYAGTVAGLFRFDVSNDRWATVPLDRLGIGLVFVSSEGILFSQMYSGGCVAAYEHLVSLDGGQHWSEDLGLPLGIPIVAFAENPNKTVWAGLPGGDLYRRDPGASHWTHHPPVDSMGTLFDLAVTSDGSLLVLAAVAETDESAVFFSDNAGESWTIPLQTSSRLRALAVGLSGYVVVGGNGDVPDTVTFFSSTTSGRGWFERPCHTDACSDLISVDRLSILQNRTVAAAGRASTRVSSNLIVSDLFMDEWSLAARYSETPSDLLTDRSGALWVVGFPYAWRSTDNAASFEPASNGLIGTSVTSLVESDGHILAAVGSYRIGGWAGITTVPGSAGVHSSADNGSTWNVTPVWQASQVTASLLDGVLAATDLGVQRSVDHGITWQTIPGTEGVAVRAVAEDSYGTLCMISGLHLSCSADGVSGWHGDIGLTYFDNALSATPDGVFLAEVFGKVHRSVDGGRTWEPTPLAEDIGQFAVSPDGVIYAPVVNSDRLAVSEDSGLTWEIIRTPIPNPLSIAFHPARGLFVGFSTLVLYSGDRFENWSRIDLRARSLLVNGDRLVAGSERQGVWLADLPPRVRRPSGRTDR